MERGPDQKKKIIKKASLFDWLRPFLQIGNDKDKHDRLWANLECLARKNNSGPEAEIRIEELKKQINQIREKNGLFAFAQLREFRNLELKPYKLPGDPDPVQPITTCRWCGSALNEKEKVCHNCGKTQISKGQPYQRKPPEKGESPSPFGTNIDKYVTPGRAVAAQSKDKYKKNRKTPDFAKHDKETVRDVFTSEPFHQCKDIRMKKKRNADIRKEEIMRSCEDLEIDG